jgi:hypothetical protein
MPNH